MATSTPRPGGRPRDATSHLFVVGLPRTGSTLTRGILNASPEVWVAGESHYFSEPTRLGLMQRRGYRERFRSIGDLRTDEGLTRIVDEIFSLQGKSFWARLARDVDRGTLEEALRSSARDERALLDVAMGLFARDRPIRGEKTPHHIYHVPTLFDWFPEARVIHTFRDPRAVYASLRRKERPEKLTLPGRIGRRFGRGFERYAVANLARSWRAMARLHREYAARYPDRYLLVRFEDLVTAPAAVAERLSTFVGIDYSDAMLEQVVHNSSFAAKASGSSIDPTTIDRWRDHLSPSARALLARHLGSELASFGYRP